MPEFTTYAAAVLSGVNNVVSASYAIVNGDEANNASARNAEIQPNGCNITMVYKSEASQHANVSFAPGTTSAFGISVIGLAGRNGGRLSSAAGSGRVGSPCPPVRLWGGAVGTGCPPYVASRNYFDNTSSQWLF